MVQPTLKVLQLTAKIISNNYPSAFREAHHNSKCLWATHHTLNNKITAAKAKILINQSLTTSIQTSVQDT